MDLEVSGHTVLLTASSAGLGKACAVSFVREGANVVVCGRTPERLDTAEEELSAVGDGEVLAVRADITEADDVRRLVQNTVDEFGGIDHLVVSSADPPRGEFMDLSLQDWYDAYDQLVIGGVLAAREAFPHLRERGSGSIVFITSRSVQEVADGHVLSNSVRRTVTGLMKSLSREFAPEVRVNSVRPGYVYTDPPSPSMQAKLDEHLSTGAYATADDVVADIASSVPLRRVAEVDDLGDVVTFLSSARARHVNGTAVAVDGGGLRS